MQSGNEEGQEEVEEEDLVIEGREDGVGDVALEVRDVHHHAGPGIDLRSE